MLAAARMMSRLPFGLWPRTGHTRCLSALADQKKLVKKKIGLCIGYVGTRYSGLQVNQLTTCQ